MRWRAPPPPSPPAPRATSVGAGVHATHPGRRAHSNCDISTPPRPFALAPGALHAPRRAASSGLPRAPNARRRAALRAVNAGVHATGTRQYRKSARGGPRPACRPTHWTPGVPPRTAIPGARQTDANTRRGARRRGTAASPNPLHRRSRGSAGWMPISPQRRVRLRRERAHSTRRRAAHVGVLRFEIGGAGGAAKRVGAGVQPGGRGGRHMRITPRPLLRSAPGSARWSGRRRAHPVAPRPRGCTVTVAT